MAYSPNNNCTKSCENLKTTVTVINLLLKVGWYLFSNIVYKLPSVRKHVRLLFLQLVSLNEPKHERMLAHH